MSIILCVCGNQHKRSEQCTRCRKPTRSSHGKTTAERGYGHDWRKLSERIRTEEPLCKDCESVGRIRPATECHHLIKIREAPNERLNLGNVIGLCHECHQIRTERGE
jgi:5-methylcytosine-specific restriction endonuclease McrA